MELGIQVPGAERDPPVEMVSGWCGVGEAGESFTCSTRFKVGCVMHHWLELAQDGKREIT